MRKMWRAVSGVATLAVLVSVVACATTGRSNDSYDRRYLSTEQLQSVRVGSLYEAIQRLRPLWLDVRASRSISAGAPDIVVYRGETLMGGREVLHRLSPSIARFGVRYIDGSVAYASRGGLGTRQVAGAIIILTEPPEEDD